jgi:predicted dehydrogenase
MKQYKALLVGNGTMGKRHRERFEACGVQFVAVADNYSEFNGIAIKLNLYNAGVKARIRDIDFVVVASPATTHYAYAKFFLERGVPVFVEKPLATTGPEAQELVDMARREGISLFVAQSECYNPVFLNFRKHFAAEMNKQCGGDVRLEFRREHKYSERCRDVNVALDLLVHDLSLFFTMFRAQDVKVERFQISPDNDDAAWMTLRVDAGEYRGVVADFYVNRNSDCDNRTIAVDFGRDETSPESRYTVSLARYTQEGEIEHIPDSLENEHRFFLKLLAGACGEWGLRAAQNAADCVKFAVHQ